MPDVVGRRFDSGADAAKPAIADASVRFRVPNLPAGAGGLRLRCCDSVVFPAGADAPGRNDPRRRRRPADGACGRNSCLEFVHDRVLPGCGHCRCRRRAGRTDPVRLSRAGCRYASTGADRCHFGWHRKLAGRAHRQLHYRIDLYIRHGAVSGAGLYHPVPADDLRHCIPASGLVRTRRRMKWIAATPLVALLLLLPFFAGDFYVNLASQILIAAIFALSLNLLVGYGGMTSLGHASYLGVGAYISALLTSRYGFGHGAAAIISIAGTTLMAAFFGVIALRATGLGFLMITLALSQVLWGLAYRMSDVTNGDNGIAGLTRPTPFGISLDSATSFYWFALIMASFAFLMMTTFVSSSFGSSLKGVRDQPRRMAALGFNPWMIRWITFIYAGFWGGISGLLYVYYNKYIHPTSLSTTSSAEALLGVIAGGSGTLGGPAVGAALVLLLKNYASAYIERWNMLLGLVFLFIVLVMPTGIVPGLSRLLAGMRRESQ